MSVLSSKRPHSLDDLSSPSVGGKRLRNSIAVHNFHKRDSLLKDVDSAQIHVGGILQFSQNVPPSPPQNRITAIPRTPRSPTTMAAALATTPTIRNHITNVDMTSYRTRTYSWDDVLKIVDVAVKEREASLRREYEAMVQEKLSEQFQTFTKFNSDYIHRQLRESQFDYMS